MVMEHINGKSLEKAVRDSRKPMDTDRVIELSDELSQILHYLHSQNPIPSYSGI